MPNSPTTGTVRSCETGNTPGIVTLMVDANPGDPNNGGQLSVPVTITFLAGNGTTVVSTVHADAVAGIGYHINGGVYPADIVTPTPYGALTCTATSP